MVDLREDYFITFPLISAMLIIVGIGIKIYLKKTGLNDLRRVLGIGVFWIKFFANALIVIGSFCLITFFVAVYFHLQYLGYF